MTNFAKISQDNMRTDNIQDLRALESRLFEVAQEAVSERNTAVGVAINARTLECRACTQHEADNNGMEWYSISTLTDDGQPSYDAVADLAAKYCFVR